jgi:hypothetical protein
MPKQEIFWEQQVGERRIEVLKSYDQGYAGEVFKNMDEHALKYLWDIRPCWASILERLERSKR